MLAVKCRFPFGVCIPIVGTTEPPFPTCAQPFAWVPIPHAERLHFFTQAELDSAASAQSCHAQPLHKRCCIGAISKGGHQGRARCLVDVTMPTDGALPPLGQQRYALNFMRQFTVTVPPSIAGGRSSRTTFGMADALSLLPEGGRLVILGDSLSTQLWDATLCDLARTAGVEMGTVTEHDRAYLQRRYGSGIISWEDVDVTLSPGPDGSSGSSAILRKERRHQSHHRKRVTISHAREFRFSLEGVREACEDNTAVLVYNYGAHLCCSHDAHMRSTMLVPMALVFP